MNAVEKNVIENDLWKEYVRYPRYSWIVIGSKAMVKFLFKRAFNIWLSEHSEYNREECFKFIANFITKEAMRISKEGRVLVGSNNEEQVQANEDS